MGNSVKGKRLKALLTLLVVGFVAVIASIYIISQVQRPEKIWKIEVGETYIAFLGEPSRKGERYYVELREDGTYSLINEKTRHYYSASDEDSVPLRTYYVEGTYETKGDTYLLTPLKGECIVFSDAEAVEKKEISPQNNPLSKEDIHENFGEMCVSVFQNEKGYYLLGYPSSDGFNYDENGMTYLKIQSSETYDLYESDLDDIPDTTEEFLAQFTVIDDEDE